MKIKTADLTGAALDWAVAKVEGRAKEDGSITYLGNWTPSTDWPQGGPIIEREKIDLNYDTSDKLWSANGQWGMTDDVWIGNTPLEAAMRCHVASELGDEVEIPDELVGGQL